jgi:hypothetical protein
MVIYYHQMVYLHQYYYDYSNNLAAATAATADITPSSDALYISKTNIIDYIQSKYFRIYWLALNFSYVMEFFLQTLVKKHYLKQQTMLILQQILMLASSIVAINLLSYISFAIAIVSLVANFVYRKHDFFNTVLVFVMFATLAANEII